MKLMNSAKKLVDKIDAIFDRMIQIGKDSEPRGEEDCLTHLWDIRRGGGGGVVPVHTLEEGMRPEIRYAVLSHPVRIGR